MNPLVAKTILFTLMSIAGILYATKYKDQWDKINRLGTSRGVSRTYFIKGIVYELFCFICTVALICIDPYNYVSWILLVLTVLPLIGNTVVFIKALIYSPISHKKNLKYQIYRFLRRKLNEYIKTK